MISGIAKTRRSRKLGKASWLEGTAGGAGIAGRSPGLSRHPLGRSFCPKISYLYRVHHCARSSFFRSIACPCQVSEDSTGDSRTVVRQYSTWNWNRAVNQVPSWVRMWYSVLRKVRYMTMPMTTPFFLGKTSDKSRLTHRGLTLNTT